MPPVSRTKGLLLRRLPVLGIFHVEGDGDGNISLSEKERRDLSSGVASASVLMLSPFGEGIASNPTGVNGLLRPEMFDGRPLATSFADSKLIEVAITRVAISVMPGTIGLIASFRLFEMPLALGCRAKPSLAVPITRGLNEGNQT